MTTEIVHDSPELKKLAASITAYNDGVRGSFQKQMGYAFLAGLALNRAKELIPHGEFMPWAKANLPHLSHRTAGRYMALADRMIKKSPAVGKLDTVSTLMLEGPSDKVANLSDAEAQKVIKVVHDVADGKTLTELYRDLGVIRKPKKPSEYAVRKGEMTPEEELKARKAQALELVRIWKSAAAPFLAGDDTNILPLLPAATVREMEEIRLELSSAFKPYLRGDK